MITSLLSLHAHAVDSSTGLTCSALLAQRSSALSAALATSPDAMPIGEWEASRLYPRYDVIPPQLERLLPSMTLRHVPQLPSVSAPSYSPAAAREEGGAPHVSGSGAGSADAVAAAVAARATALGVLPGAHTAQRRVAVTHGSLLERDADSYRTIERRALADIAALVR